MNNSNFTIISFYQFKKLNKLNKLKFFFSDLCSFQKLKGTIIFSPEGINGSISGLSKSIDQFKRAIYLQGFRKLDIKSSFYPYMPFNRLKIKIKKEIITFSKIKLDVENNTAAYVKPNQWNKLIENKNTLVLDVRNIFEQELGSFKNSFKSKIKKFSEFKKFVDKELTNKKNKKIAMFCTGGIRCEKASSYMLKKGFKNLFQLQGGILKYLKNTPKEQSRWEGECFVFDNRVSIKNELENGTYQLCYGCRMPISSKDLKSVKYEKGVSCITCFDSISNEKKKKLRERNKQIEIAKRKGIYSPYIKYTPFNFL